MPAATLTVATFQRHVGDLLAGIGTRVGAALRDQRAALHAELAARDERIARAEAEIAELRRRLDAMAARQ